MNKADDLDKSEAKKPASLTRVEIDATAANRPSKQDRSEDDEDDEDDDEDEDSLSGGPLDELAKLRREKRLAMNRESARVRRKRKKLMLETLEAQASELTRQNQRSQQANEQLHIKVAKLERELALAKSTISLLTNGQGASSTSHLGAAAGYEAFGSPTGALGSPGGLSGRGGSIGAASESSRLGLGGGLHSLPQNELQHLLLLQQAQQSQQQIQSPSSLYLDAQRLRQQAFDLESQTIASREASMANAWGRLVPSAPSFVGLQSNQDARSLLMGNSLGLENYLRSHEMAQLHRSRDNEQWLELLQGGHTGNLSAVASARGLAGTGGPLPATSATIQALRNKGRGDGSKTNEDE